MLGKAVPVSTDCSDDLSDLLASSSPNIRVPLHTSHSKARITLDVPSRVNKPPVDR